MRTTQQIIISVISFLTVSCHFFDDKKKSDPFYDSIAGWDIIAVPIIKPYKAGSTTGGNIWILNTEDGEEIDRFGVTQNVIYGRGTEGWFLYDTKSKLLAHYKSKEELTAALKSLHLPINTIDFCKRYFDTLSQGKTCYWFPKDGRNYPDYPDLTPVGEVTTINITEKPQQQPEIHFNENLKRQSNKIYFFKLSYNKKDNDQLHINFYNNQSILVKDSLLIPVFANKDSFGISLYIPSPPKENGYPQAHKFLLHKKFYIR